MGTIKCKECGETQTYKKLALPAGDIRYWRCPKCKVMGEGEAVN